MVDLLSIENIVALLTLTALEVVLGIDNVVVIAIVVDKLRAQQRKRARQIGLFLAMFTRILLLLSLTWIMRLTTPLFSTFGHEVSGRDLLLLVGGLFLLAKSTLEIHHAVEGGVEGEQSRRAASFWSAIVQIVMLDIIFSLDSVVTAVGMTSNLPVMILAIVVAVLIMLVFANSVSRFIEIHPTLKMLALSFILLIGVMLVAEGIGKHIERGYIYFAMSFSLLVESLNITMRVKSQRQQNSVTR